MGREAVADWYPTHGAYFTTYSGTRYILHASDHDDRPDGPNYRAALDELQWIISGNARLPARDARVRPAVRRYRLHLKRSRRKDWDQFAVWERGLTQAHPETLVRKFTAAELVR